MPRRPDEAKPWLERAPERGDIASIQTDVRDRDAIAAGLTRHQLETEPRYARCVRHVIPLGELQTTAQVARATAYLCSTPPTP